MTKYLSFSTALRPVRRRLWAIPTLTLALAGGVLATSGFAIGHLAFSAFVGLFSLFLVMGYDWRCYTTNQALFVAYWLVVTAELLLVGLPAGSSVSNLPQASLGGVNGSLLLLYFPALYMIVKIALLQPIWKVWRVSAKYRFNTG